MAVVVFLKEDEYVPSVYRNLKIVCEMVPRFPVDSPNQIWTISGQWFYKRIVKNWPKMHKITHNSMKTGVAPKF